LIPGSQIAVEANKVKRCLWLATLQLMGPSKKYPQSSRFLRCRVVGPLLKRHVAAVRRSALFHSLC
jgi:hypothetical protein